MTCRLIWHMNYWCINYYVCVQNWTLCTVFPSGICRSDGSIDKLKGKFPQTTMWIGWVESNFTNPTVKFWADLDNPFKTSDYAKLCMLPSLDGTLPEYVISQEDNSPLTLYIDFQHFQLFLDINSPFSSSSFINACTFISALTYLLIYKRRGKIHFHEKWNFVKNLCTVPLDSCTVMTSHILEECHLRGRHTQK